MSVTLVSGSLRRAVIERDGTCCLSCGVQCTPDWWSPTSLHIDHIQPESLGGPTILDNLQVLCRTCNLAKGATCIDYRTDERWEPTAEMVQVYIEILRTDEARRVASRQLRFEEMQTKVRRSTPHGRAADDKQRRREQAVKLRLKRKAELSRPRLERQKIGYQEFQAIVTFFIKIIKWEMNRESLLSGRGPIMDSLIDPEQADTELFDRVAACIQTWRDGGCAYLVELEFHEAERRDTPEFRAQAREVEQLTAEHHANMAKLASLYESGRLLVSETGWQLVA